MKTVRFVAGILFYVSRILALSVLLVAIYATSVVLLHLMNASAKLPLRVVDDNTFYIFYPFTGKVFLLGDYTASYLITNLLMILFYGVFLWMLSAVFNAFRQQKIFSKKGVVRLSRFYVLNFLMPILFIALLISFGREALDLIRLILLHLIIGVFAFFMAAIFKEGLILQEEQDLTF